MSKILKGLFLGSAIDGNNRKHLLGLGISHILVVASEVPIFHENDFKYKKISIADQINFDISPHLQQMVDFIAEGVSKGGVLVHCMRGDTRSSSAVAAYLMSRERMTLKKAFNLLKAKYPNFSISDHHKVVLSNYRKSVRKAPGKKISTSQGSLRRGRQRSEKKLTSGFGQRGRRGVIGNEIKTLLKDFSKLNSTKQQQAEVRMRAQGSKTKRSVQAAVARKKINQSFDKKQEKNSGHNPLLSFGKEFIHKTYSSYLRNSRNQTVAIACRTALAKNKASIVSNPSQRSTESSYQNQHTLKGLKGHKKKRTSHSITDSTLLRNLTLDPKTDIQHTLQGIQNLISYIPKTKNKNTKYKTDFYKNKSKFQRLKKKSKTAIAKKRLQNIYKCGKCSKTLFLQSNLKLHKTEKFERKLCKSYFIELPQWCKHETFESITKIHCPGCQEIIGEGRAAGLMCSCGYLRSPAFRIAKDKISKVEIKPAN